MFQYMHLIFFTEGGSGANRTRENSVKEKYLMLHIAYKFKPAPLLLLTSRQIMGLSAIWSIFQVSARYPSMQYKQGRGS